MPLRGMMLDSSIPWTTVYYPRISTSRCIKLSSPGLIRPGALWALVVVINVALNRLLTDTSQTDSRLPGKLKPRSNSARSTKSRITTVSSEIGRSELP